MQKRWILVFICISSCLWAQAQMCEVKNNEPLKLLHSELMRNFKVLKTQKPPVYYLSYRYNEVSQTFIEASYNGVSTQQDQDSNVTVMVRVGSTKLDNTRALKGEMADYDLVSDGYLPFAQLQDPKAFQLDLWSATQKAVEKAQQQYSQVLAHSRTRSQAADQSDDFVFPPKETYCEVSKPQTIDIEKVKALLAAGAKLPLGKPYVLNYNVSFSYTHKQNYFVDSRGTQLTFPSEHMRLLYTLSNRTEDGMDLQQMKTYDIASLDELPSQEQFLADITQSLQKLEQLTKAQPGAPFTAPTLLKGRAAAVFVHEVLGHRLEGHRQKDEAYSQTFTGKVGQPVISPLLTIIDDPTQIYFNGAKLRGHYVYDDEGVKSRPVTLVENGVLKNFLMSSNPIKGFPTSNGHGRLGGAHRAVARMGVMRATSSQTVSYEELEQKLIEEIKRQGKPYGFIIEDLGGGYTFTSKSMPQSFKLETKLVWRVYPDGRKEMVRGLDVVGTPLVSFNKVLAVGNDDTVFDGSCGAESGWVTQTNIAPSILFSDLEMQKTETSSWKPPLLPSPLLEKGGKK